MPEGQPAPAEKSGLYQMPDADGDGVTEGATLIAPFIDAVQEHGVHALRRGPDGALTMMTGNNTFFVDETQIDPASPFAGGRESQFLPVVQDGRGFGPSAKIGAHGTVHRVDPVTKRFTIVAGAFRNAYDHAFNLEGELFTFDSDMEWDIGMPWYRDIRTVHVVPGGDYGYRNGSGKLPAWAHDSLPPLRDVGRGSPVGVEFYQSRAYPTAMHDALLEADWSRGRLLYTPLTRKGASYTARGRPHRAGARRAAQHHRRRGRPGRPGLLHDRRTHHRGRRLPDRLQRSAAGDGEADAAARGGAPAAAALELGPRRGGQGEGRSRRRMGERPRGAGPRSRRPAARIAPRRSTCCSATARRRRCRCSPT